MQAARAVLLDQGFDCATLTIVHDPETTRYVPDFSHPMRDYFRFPWERGEATPAARALRQTGAPAHRSTELPFIGLDLDGVFLPDIPRAHYDCRPGRRPAPAPRAGAVRRAAAISPPNARW